MMRIASLLASATEMVYGLGLGEQLVAISHECDFPSECTKLPRVTRTTIDPTASSGAIDRQVRELLAAGSPLYSINVERLTELGPDLIVTQAQCDVCAVRYEDVANLVRPAGPLPNATVMALNPFTLGDVWADIKRLGEATSRVAEAASYCAELQERVAAVAQVAGQIPEAERPVVACIEWIEPLMLAANWMPEIIQLAGGRQPFTVGGRHSTYSAWDDVLRVDPDVIVVMPCGFDLERTVAEARVLRDRPEWSRLRAVRAGRVHAVDGNALFNRSGPRLVDSLELLAALLHPHRSTAPGVDAARPL